jgi:predicted RNA-binding Zn ribbon-like protein
VSSYPEITGEGHLTWTVRATPTQSILVEAITTWDELQRTRPGRLRPCTSDECTLFLIDRSKSNSAKWCSMSVCGNRLKARRHHDRARFSD